MIVVDTNILAYAILKTDYTTEAERLFDRDPEWAAPPLWRCEFANVLTLQMRHRKMAPDVALRAFALAEARIGMEHEVAAYEVLRCAGVSNLSAYHCTFVALASDLRVPLVTPIGGSSKRFQISRSHLPSSSGRSAATSGTR